MVAVTEAETVVAVVDVDVAADVVVAVAADFVAHAVDDNYYEDNAAYPDPNPAAVVAEAETDAVVAVVDEAETDALVAVVDVDVDMDVYVVVAASVDAADAVVVSAVDDNYYDNDAAFETDDLDEDSWSDVHGVDYCFGYNNVVEIVDGDA